MTISISTQEIFSYPALHQTILRILKEKGAPVRGSFFLSVLPGWTVTAWDDVSGTKHFRFEQPTRDGSGESE